MARFASISTFGQQLNKHRRIIWALLMRELSTRYGRNGLGFLWVIGEPMIFALAVAALWNIIRPPFEYGIRVVPFTVTGYMPLILVRQTVNFVVSAVRVNAALLYHRQITPLHIMIGRFGIEFIGVTLGYILIVIGMCFVGLMNPPKDILTLIFGWFLLGWMSFGIAMIIGALSEIIESVERVSQLITYILIPLSGAFFMAASIPPSYRGLVLMLPFIHCFEMMRGAYFGPSLKTYYSVSYAIEWSACLTLVGLLMVQFVRNRVEVD